MIQSAEAMEALGAEVARVVPRGSSIYLVGPLAAGKTTFARGYVRECGHRGAVKSPTFTLVETYELAAATVHHFDLYRIAAAAELEFIGIEDYFDDGADILVEWAERGAGVLPDADLVLTITPAGMLREIVLEAHSDLGTEAIYRINKLYISES